MIVIIYELLQRKKAMLGYELQGNRYLKSNHVGASIEEFRNFCTIDGAKFSGDYGTMRFTSKNCLLFKAIYTTKESYDNSSTP